MTRRLLTLLSLTALAGAAAAQPKLDPEPRSPYRWRVAVRAARHPALRADFTEPLHREIRAALQAALGPSGEVEVFDLATPPDPANPLWPVVREKGVAAFDPDAARELTAAKTHLLTIDYRDGQFLLETRQYDGFSGLAMPQTRRQTTRAAEMVARLAGLMLEPDLGPVGTVEFIPGDADNVKVTLRAGAISPVDQWVKPGDLFAVSAVRDVPRPVKPDPKADPRRTGPAPSIRTGVPIPFTFLKVIETVKDGACKCIILTRWRDPFGRDVLGRDARRRVGLRAMKLSTTEARVGVKLVAQDGTPHARGSLLKVAATDTSFRTIPSADDIFELRDGVYRSPRTLANVACIAVAVGTGPPQLFPVPVLSGEPVLLRFDVKPEDEDRAAFARECNDLRGRIAELGAEQITLFAAINNLLDKSKNRDALARAEDGVGRVEAAAKQLADDLKVTREKPGAAQDDAKKVLDSCDRQLAAVAAGQARLTRTVAALKDSVKASASPEALDKEFRAKELAERIKDQVSRGDIDDALKTYDDLIREVPAQQDLKDQREKLQAEWATTDEEHRRANDALRTWQQAKTAAEYRDALVAMKKACEVFLRKKDKLRLKKFLNTIEPAYAALSLLVNATDGTTDEGTKALKELEYLVEYARVVEGEAREFLRKLGGK